MSNYPEGDDNDYKDLYIGNIPYSYDKEYLDNLFNCKSMEIRISVDSRTNRSKGFGFATFPSHEEALDILQRFNGHEVDGRKLIIRWDRGLRAKVLDDTYVFNRGEKRRSEYRQHFHRRSQSRSRHNSQRRYRSTSNSRSPPRRSKYSSRRRSYSRHIEHDHDTSDHIRDDYRPRRPHRRSRSISRNRSSRQSSHSHQEYRRKQRSYRGDSTKREKYSNRNDYDRR
ncbi:Ribonucleoprotein [Entamoeba marina]